MILVVGMHSYIAKEFLSANKSLAIRAIGHEDISNPAHFKGVDCIINFAFAPELHSQAYDRALDIDTSLAEQAAQRGIHYVMLSSRKVYHAKIEWNATEEAAVEGIDTYGRNKVRIENTLREMLGDRLTILRPGNVFGYEVIPGRARFGAYLLNQLANGGGIHLSLSPFIRRDIVPVDFFCEVLRTVAEKKPGGIFNVGIGEAVEIGRVALWLLDGFGSGALIVDGHDEVDQFQLDCTRQREVLGMSCSRAQLMEFTKGLGSRLAIELGRHTD